MTNVLWFSQHPLTEGQLDGLKATLGEVAIDQVNKTISSAEELAENVAAADVIAVVAPPELTSAIFKLANGKPVIYSVSARERMEDGTFQFRHLEWRHYRTCDVTTEHFA